MQKNTINKYLENYAEQESHGMNGVLRAKDSVYQYVVVIPVCSEADDCLNAIFSEIDKSLSVLIILVVNSPESNKNPDFFINNQILINKLKANSNLVSDLSNSCSLLNFTGYFDVLLIDRNSQGLQINDKLGVGLARKIGCDVALKLFQMGKISCPWIFSTDADVILPDNYFPQIHQVISDCSALVLDFEHIGEDSLINNLQFYYDFKIRYYHAGIIYAGSEYDYIPLGSTLIVRMDSYAQVRGFPKKNAGEDFYLLNKLAKVNPVIYNKNVKIKIKARFSNRVPFGTGPALMQISALEYADDYLYYHPKCFVLLKQWKHYLQSMWTENHLKIKPPDSPELFSLFQFFKCAVVFNKSKTQITSQQRWAQFVHQWFDSFKTLKAVHQFDQYLGKVKLKQLLKSSDFAKVTNLSLQIFLINNDKT